MTRSRTLKGRKKNRRQDKDETITDLNYLKLSMKTSRSMGKRHITDSMDSVDIFKKKNVALGTVLVCLRMMQKVFVYLKKIGFHEKRDEF